MEETAYSILEEKDKSKTLDRDLKVFQDRKAFERLFREYYPMLCHYCMSFVKQSEVAEELVQDTFVALWEKGAELKIQLSLKAYLFTAVRNRSLNYLKSPAAGKNFDSDFALAQKLLTDNTQESLDYEELRLLLKSGIESLPPQCRTIFELSRSGGFSNQEIARKLRLSPKTVENQMGIALKKLKEHLRHHWDFLLVLLLIMSQNEWILLAK